MLEEYCRKNEGSLGLNEGEKNDLDLMNLQGDNSNEKKVTGDLLNLDFGGSGQQNEQKSVKNFLGNLLDQVNTSHKQTAVSNKPIESDFSTDMVHISLIPTGPTQLPGPQDYQVTLR